MQSPLERWLVEEKDRHGAYAEVKLVLLHRNAALPQGTREWLKPRQVKRHHHLRAGDETDMARLARFLASNTLALWCWQAAA